MNYYPLNSFIPLAHKPRTKHKENKLKESSALLFIVHKEVTMALQEKGETLAFSRSSRLTLLFFSALFTVFTA